jgi:hypothetical protein
MEKQVVLHIGGERTGSTTIQMALAKASFKVLADNGVLYPVHTPLLAWIDHNPVAAAFLEGAPAEFISADRRISPETVIEQLRWSASYWPHRLIVLSSELFSSRLEGPRITALREALRVALPDYRVRIIYFARAQASLYSSVVANSIFFLWEYWRPVRAITCIERFFNHALLLSDWASAFGAENITVLNYHAGDTLSQFSNLIGIKLEAPRQRVSLSYEECKLLQVLARALGPLNPLNQTDQGGVQNEHVREQLRDDFLSAYKELGLPKTPLALKLTENDYKYFECEFGGANDLLQKGFNLGFNLNNFQRPYNNLTLARLA